MASGTNPAQRDFSNVDLSDFDHITGPPAKMPEVSVEETKTDKQEAQRALENAVKKCRQAEAAYVQAELRFERENGEMARLALQNADEALHRAREDLRFRESMCEK